MTTPLPIGLRRLLKLAERLDKGKLGHKYFSFSVVNEGIGSSQGCGTHGCAMGELPIVFPKQWKFVGGVVQLRNQPDIDSDELNVAIDQVSSFFGIDSDETKFLFFPVASGLGDHATRKQVARHIRRFVEGKVAK